MVAITMQRGSYKQLQDKAPVFMLAGGKAHCIGVKESVLIDDEWDLTEVKKHPLEVRTVNDKVIKLNKKAARCCFGFYEVINEQLETSLA